MNAEDAFIPPQDQRLFFASGPASMVLSQLERGLEDASPVIVLTGEAGVGKTTVVREALARWGSRVTPVWFEPEADQPPEKTLLKQIRAFGGHGRAKDERPELIARMAHALNDITARGSTPMLIVDDAHRYDLEMLAEVGRIESAAIAADQNLKLLLVGAPQLNDILDKEELEILSQRLALSCRLEPMEQADTRQYLNHRVGATNPDAPNAFSRKAARDIHMLTRGVPSAINPLADDARSRAQANSAGVVTPDHVRAVMASSRRASPRPQPPAAAPSAPPKPAATTPSAALKRPAAQAPSGPPPGQPERRSGAPSPMPPPRSATPNAPGGPKHAQPVPAKVKRVPPPPPPAAPVEPVEPAVDLDSSHPRVKEWVSRFTDGQPLRIGGPMPPPITDPTAIPDQPIFADEDELLLPPSEVPPEAALQAPIPDELPLPPVPPAAMEPPPSVPDPAPPAPEPHAVELANAAPLVSPDALAPPPLVLDEKPAEATPSGSMRRPATPQAPPAASVPQAPKASTARPSGSMPKPKQAASAPQAPKPTPAPATAKSTPPKAAKPAAKPAPKPAPKAPAQRPAAEPPTLLTKNDVKAHKPAQWHDESKPVAKPQPKPVAAAAFDEPDDETLPSPTVYRVLAALIPIVLILGMAATAIVLSRRSAFDREPEEQQASAPPAASESVQAVPAVPVPTATPAPPPLVVTPDTEVTADTRISSEAQATPDTQATPPIAPPPTPAPKPRYCLSVGTFLFSDRARARTEQLSRLTHMKSWVVTTTADGSFTYRVMLGGFVKQSDAERMADKLLSSGLVSEALVEKLPPQ